MLALTDSETGYTAKKRSPGLFDGDKRHRSRRDRRLTIALPPAFFHRCLVLKPPTVISRAGQYGTIGSKQYAIIRISRKTGRSNMMLPRIGESLPKLAKSKGLRKQARTRPVVAASCALTMRYPCR